MDFSWTAEQELLRRNLRRLGRELSALEEGGEAFPEEAWRRCAATGIFELGRAPEAGGAPDLLTAAGSLEALASETQDNGLLFSIVGQICSAVYPLAAFGSDEQRRRYLGPLCSGELVGASATTEAEAGSDVLSLATRYHRDGDGFVLDGAKVFVTSAPVAGLFLVLARGGHASAASQLSYFLVERGAEGLQLGPSYRKMGLRSSPMAELVLTDCRVPGEGLLGPEGGAPMLLQAILEWERIALVACHVGTMARVLGLTVAHARRRRQFGKRIVDHQQIGAKLADARVGLEASRLLVYHAAWCKAGGRSAPLEAAVAKLFVSERYVSTCLDALQIHGAYGYMEELGLEGQIRDALASTIYAGTSEIQRNIIAALL